MHARRVALATLMVVGLVGCAGQTFKGKAADLRRAACQRAYQQTRVSVTGAGQHCRSQGLHLDDFKLGRRHQLRVYDPGYR